MRNYVVITLCIVAAMSITGCGDTSNMMSKSFSEDNMLMTNAVADEAYYTGGDYSSTSIDGEQVDYSYTFTAGGETDKSKEDMLEDYERIQKFVTSNGGYIESVYNDYTFFTDEDTRYNETAIEYKAQGQLQFTVQIENSYVQDVVDELERICKQNEFVVHNYTQRIQNYKNWNVVKEDYEEYRYNTITEDELNRRLAYADIDVRMTYSIPRGCGASTWIEVKNWVKDLWQDIKGIVSVIAVSVIMVVVLLVEAIICYKVFVRMIAKHKKNKPEYYQPKTVVVKKIEEE